MKSDLAETNSPQRHHLVGYGVFLILALPILAAGYFAYDRMNRDLTDLAVSRRQAITDLAANALKTKLDRLVDIGVSLAAAQNVRTSALNNQWPATMSAITRLQGFPALSDDFIDRIVVTDENGIEQGAYPENSVEIGRNLSFREWFQPVAKDNLPYYLSSAYHRTATPQYNIVAVAVPVRDDHNALQAIIVLEVPVYRFLDLSNSVEVGPNGFAYFVDQKGQVIAHPKYDLKNGELVDYSSIPAVQAAFREEKGINVFYNQIENEERLTAYRQIQKYHWAVIVQQPIASAFQERDGILNNVRAAIFIIIIIAGIIAYAFMRGFKHRNAGGIGPGSPEGGFTLIELLVVIGIIIVLSVVVVIVLNPTELLKQSRDSRRLSDMRTLKTALNLYVVDVRTPNLATGGLGYNACYLSTPQSNGTTAAKCGVFSGTYSSGNASTTAALLRNIDGTGWLPVDLTQISAGTPVSALPIDPINNSSTYYAYAATSTWQYELNTFLESSKYTNNLINDGGDNVNVYETGNRPGLNL
ncbi:MAG TPA: cache domain-containing protein [Candidatus Paceibacterota bacterium]|nr:cache domain-containing protein [Candidatus Paceibacterota bacterium]